MKWKIAYYNVSVEQSIRNLDKSVKAKYFAITDMMLEHGPNLGMPYMKAIGDGLFEIRAKGPRRNSARIFLYYFIKYHCNTTYFYEKKSENTKERIRSY